MSSASDESYEGPRFSSSSESDDYDVRVSEDNLEKLKSLRTSVNWENIKERKKLYDELIDLIHKWKGPRPNFWDFFRPEEMDWLLAKDLKKSYEGDSELIFFVRRAGFKDQPDLDEDGRPAVRRVTAVHRAHEVDDTLMLDVLFDIYDRYDVNYADESGLTHLHVASRHGSSHIVRKFLEHRPRLGEIDPRDERGNTPLHLALRWGERKVALMLLKAGADPNLADENGWTTLHLVCERESYYDGNDEKMARIIFDIADKLNRPVQMEARDNLGRTPLQWAVASLFPHYVEAFLDRGADLSSFAFPSADHLDERFRSWYEASCDDMKLRMVSGAVGVMEILRTRGYAMKRQDALTLMRFFLNFRVFDKSEYSEGYSYADDEELASQAQRLEIRPGLSIYDLVILRAHEATKHLSHKEYFELSRSHKLEWLRAEHSEPCIEHLCEILPRQFCRAWALDPMMELTRQRLPILCCEMIIGILTNEDLCRVCLAATARAS